MTIPGVPTIYYGDEFGSPGGNDPDNRRMMKFSGLDRNEISTLEITKKIINIRKNNLALLFGDFRTFYVDQDIYVYARSYFSNKLIVVFNRSKEGKEVVIHLADDLAGHNYTASFGSKINIDEKTLSVQIQDNSFEILIAK
jgi:cyclomaltodextrinase / maltogenic alpha-amylase / neopullulanase